MTRLDQLLERKQLGVLQIERHVVIRARKVPVFSTFGISSDPASHDSAFEDVDDAPASFQLFLSVQKLATIHKNATQGCDRDATTLWE